MFFLEEFRTDDLWNSWVQLDKFFNALIIFEFSVQKKRFALFWVLLGIIWCQLEKLYNLRIQNFFHHRLQLQILFEYVWSLLIKTQLTEISSIWNPNIRTSGHLQILRLSRLLVWVVEELINIELSFTSSITWEWIRHMGQTTLVRLKSFFRS
jgi:hypothetical protein